MEEIIVPLIILAGVIYVISKIVSSGNRSRRISLNQSRLDILSRQLDTLEEKVDEILRRTSSSTSAVQVETKIKVKPQTPVTEYKIPEPSTIFIDEMRKPIFENVPPEIDDKEFTSEPQIVEPEPTDYNYTPQPGYEHLYQPSESWWTRFNKRNPDLEKFVGENLISKIGIAILVLGIAFFVKYAIDKNWINEYARVGVGILAGGVVLVFAHRLREKFKSFSSILVSGAIAIFYFTITIGFQEYNIFSQPVAFAIMIGITAFSVFISLAYNRQELAVLSLIGGFAAPFMVSTGEGNYKVLFTYLLILDAGMLVISFLRNWKLVYILSYVFTILIYGTWYFQKIQNQNEPPYFGAFVFATLFYITFFIMGIVNNIKEKKEFKAADLSMILIFNFLYCGAGLDILSNYHPELKGTFIIALSAFNCINSWVLYRQFKADKTLVYLLIGLTLSYATLAAPIQLHGHHITLFWAAEAVVLMWLAQRSDMRIFRFSSVIVHVLMFISLVMDWQQNYFLHQEEILTILLNKGFVTSMFCFVSLLVQIYLLWNEEIEVKFADFKFDSKVYRVTLIILAIIIFYLSGLFELSYQMRNRLNQDVLQNLVLFSYHFIFSAGIIYFILRRGGEKFIFFSYVLGILNTAALILSFSSLPFELVMNSIGVGTSIEPGFLFHYISLAAYVFSIILLIKNILTKGNTETNVIKYVYWSSSVLLVCILSAELMLHLLTFVFNPVIPTGSDANFDIWFYVEHFRIQVLKTGFPILWGVIAFVLLAWGINKQIKELRIIALVLLAVTLLKLFIYDIKDVSEAGKISAFILLGVLLLIMSFMYQKIKAIILDDEK